MLQCIIFFAIGQSKYLRSAGILRPKSYNFGLFCTLTWSKSLHLSRLVSFIPFLLCVNQFCVFARTRNTEIISRSFPTLAPLLRLQLIFSLFNVDVEIKFFTLSPETLSFFSELYLLTREYFSFLNVMQGRHKLCQRISTFIIYYGASYLYSLLLEWLFYVTWLYRNLDTLAINVLLPVLCNLENFSYFRIAILFYLELIIHLGFPQFATIKNIDRTSVLRI